jgi:hypothetical protein
MTSALSAALIIIAAIAMCNWVVWPYVGYLRAVQQLEPVVDQMTQEKDRIRGILAPKLRRVRMMQQELAEIRAGLAGSGEAREFLRNLPALVEETGCTIVLADFAGGDAKSASEADQPQAVRACHASLTVLGRYDQFIALLERLQSNRHKVWVDACGAERLDARSEHFRCRLAVTVYAAAESASVAE